MKKILMALVLMPMMVVANEWTDPSTGITWNYRVGDDGGASLGNGGLAVQGENCCGALIIPSQMEGYVVTRIESTAFNDCRLLTSVKVPSCVQWIGEGAFHGCAGLTEMELPFVGCGDAVHKYDRALFGEIFGSALYDGGVEIEQHYIVSSYITYNHGVFCLPASLSRIVINSSKWIGSGAFVGCTPLRQVVISLAGGGVGDNAFQGCSGLSSVEIGGGVTEIGDYAFSGCTSLTSVRIAKGVSNIGNYAFENCRSLKSVIIPSSVMEIGWYAFSFCSGLEDLKLSSGIINIWSHAFEGCSSLTSVVIPSTVGLLGAAAFASCENLKTMTMPGSWDLSFAFEGEYLCFGSGMFWGSPVKTFHVTNGTISNLKKALEDGGMDLSGVSFDMVKGPSCVYYGIMFDVQGGEQNPPSRTVSKGEKYGELPEVSRAGYFFGGWFTAAAGGSHVSASSTVNGDVTLYAHWIRSTGGEADVSCEILDEYRTKADVGVIPVGVVNVGEAVKIAVKGLPSGVKFAAKDVVDRKTKEVTVSANSIYGTPTKSGVYAATVTATPTDRKSKMAPLVKTLTFVVRNAGEHIVRAECDAAQGSVKGMGVYASGKKVTLKATATKGWVFAGWYNGEALVSSLASYALTMPEKDVNLTARFISVAEDKAAIRLAVDGQAFSGTGGETPLPRDVTVRVGMCVEWPVAASALSATAVKVSGLPSGLKFTAKGVKATKTSAAVPANTIYGIPKTASKVDRSGKVTPSKVKITVTTAGKSKQEYILNVTVRGIPAEGTFNGGGENGLVTLTVAKTGKISGKYLADGKTWTLSAAGFDTWEDDDRMTAMLTAKSGKEVKTVRLAYEDDYICASLTSGEDFESPLFEAWRNEWKTEPQKSLAKKLKGRKVQVGEVLLTVGANGAVTAKGTFVTGFDEKKQKDITYSASCSTVLIPTESEGRYVVCLYFPPKAGRFDGSADIVEIGLGND
ncbi:MAG: leucine-rich repeat protein [bacterium]|nr:leucine-rich repeat protein [Candidatus Colisoma equi]